MAAAAAVVPAFVQYQCRDYSAFSSSSCIRTNTGMLQGMSSSSSSNNSTVSGGNNHRYISTNGRNCYNNNVDNDSAVASAAPHFHPHHQQQQHTLHQEDYYYYYDYQSSLNALMKADDIWSLSDTRSSSSSSTDGDILFSDQHDDVASFCDAFEA